MNVDAVTAEIRRIVPTLEGWCSPIRAARYATLIFERKLGVSVCLGVWGGRDVIAMALAHRALGQGKCVAVDAWSATASAAGQTGADHAYWNDQAKHDLVYQGFLERVRVLGLGAWVEVHRASSSDVAVPKDIGMLIVDGNHGPQSVKDVDRWAPSVAQNGVVFLDDLDWKGGSVRAAERRLLALGFKNAGPSDNGAFYERKARCCGG